LLDIDETLLIIQQAESLLAEHEYEVSSAHIMQLVKCSQCSAYDCEFVTLAQYLDIPLITTDKNILREFSDIANTTFIKKRSYDSLIISTLKYSAKSVAKVVFLIQAQPDIAIFN
jgi:predicted nucleic acid-binding protein